MEAVGDGGSDLEDAVAAEAPVTDEWSWSS